MSQPPLDFKSPEELKEILRLLSGRLHYINRVSGESRYMWHLAELLKAAGQMTELIGDKAVGAEFGDGWTPGTVPREAQTDRLLALLREHL